MANLPGVAYDLAYDPLILADLANASLQITSGFRALRAVYIEVCDAPDRPIREFRLPLRKLPFEDQNRRTKDADVFDCGPIGDDGVNVDAHSLVRAASELFTDPSIRSDAAAVVHAASLDPEKEQVLHVLMFSRSGDARAARTGRVVKAACIWEDAQRSAYGKAIVGLGGEIRYPMFVRAEGLAGHDHIGGFLLFNSIFEQKLSSLGFINTSFVERAWKKMLRKGSVNSHLPWERRRNDSGPGAGADVGTVTLSLDLRKSTYMMRQAQDRSRYAYWLEALAEIARDFTLSHGGIYDKFTGDGAISHFIYDHDRASDYMYPDEAMCAAFNCAQNLILASHVHLRNIEPDLDFLSGKSGAAVGIAHGPAAWSLDRDGRPVVVGAGVVNACRLCGGPAGSIRATISVKSVLEHHFHDLKFEDYHMDDDHKDLPKADDPICGQFIIGSGLISSSMDAIRNRANSIWEDVQARHR